MTYDPGPFGRLYDRSLTRLFIHCVLGLQMMASCMEGGGLSQVEIYASRRVSDAG